MVDQYTQTLTLLNFHKKTGNIWDEKLETFLWKPDAIYLGMTMELVIPNLLIY